MGLHGNGYYQAPGCGYLLSNYSWTSPIRVAMTAEDAATNSNDC